MLNCAKDRLLFAGIAAALLANPVSAGWSPLQYDTKQDFRTKTDSSVYEEMLNRLEKQEESSSDEVPKATGGTDANEAQSAIENDAASDHIELSSAATKQKEVEPAQLKAKEVTRLPGVTPDEKITDPDYFYTKAQAFLLDRQYQSALNFINRALVMRPDFWQAWYEKALIYQLSGYDAAAARRYLALLERKPDMLPAHIALGMLYRKHGNKELAENQYKKAIELSWSSFPAHYNLANLYMDEKRMDLALKEYKLCLKLDHSNARVHNNLGVIYQQRNYMEEAKREFTAASHLDPANQSFADNLQNLNSKIGQKPVPGAPM